MKNENKINKKKWKIGWGITTACNMSCRFCYSKKVRNPSTELPIHTLKNFVDINNNWIESINYGTAENSLSNTWYQLLLYIYKNYKIPQAITTNGYLSVALKNRKDSDQILHALSEVDISLDFASHQDHNHFRVNENAYNWALDTINILHEANIPTTLVMLGINKTFSKKNISGIFELARKHNCYVRINIYRPNSSQNLPPLDYNLLKKSLIWIINEFKIVSLSDPLFSSILLNEKKEDASGISSLRILPDGSITPSTYLVTEEWKKARIESIFLGDANLTNILLNDCNNMNQIPLKCKNCSVKSICKGGAIDRRIIWYNSLNEADPYCPFRNGDNISEWKYQENVKKVVSGPSIHDGYLPTLIFSP